jgi:PAS domain S-box-containing protein
VGRHISLIIPPDRIKEEEQIIASIRAGDRFEHFETERRVKGGRLIPVSLTISPIKDDDGNVIGASKIARDITSQKLAESERQKFVTLVENSTDFIGMCDLDGNPFFVNQAGLSMVGLADIDEARKTNVADFFFPEDRDRVVNEFLPAVKMNGNGEMDVRFRHFRTGEARWMAYKVVTLSDSVGNPVAYATVSQDLTERKAIEDSLRTLASDLSDANRRKNEFLAMLAHELRNPLAPISNTVQALRFGPRSPETVRLASELLERHVGQMSRLVDDLLDMSRISRGKMQLRREHVELGPIIAQAVEVAQVLCRNLNQELTVATPSHPVHVDADPVRLAQVIGNLLNNACKFTSEGGHIQLTVTVQNGTVTISVRDNGIGIPADKLPHVFEMFMQVDTSLERMSDGLGIGLTLVKAIVDVHGGSIAARSEGAGRGTEFTVTLPAVAAAGTSSAATRPADVANGTARRVLVVDDNVDGAESLAMLLRMSGHETTTAHDGPAAVDVARRFMPHAILLDIGLPKMSGFEVCRRIRSEDWGRDVFMVAVTGWGQDEDRNRSRDAGFDAHLVKPVDHKALLGMIATGAS